MIPLTFDLLEFFLGLLVLAGGGIFAYHKWMQSRRDRAQDRQEEVARKYQDLANDLATLSGRMEQMPSVDALRDLATSVNRVEVELEQMPSAADIRKLSDSVAEMRGEFSGVKNQVGMIHEHLLNGARGI